jgi:hypothetical protein
MKRERLWFCAEDVPASLIAWSSSLLLAAAFRIADCIRPSCPIVCHAPRRHFWRHPAAHPLTQPN